MVTIATFATLVKMVESSYAVTNVRLPITCSASKCDWSSLKLFWKNPIRILKSYSGKKLSSEVFTLQLSCSGSDRYS